jgi:hypothetical protein
MAMLLKMPSGVTWQGCKLKIARGSMRSGTCRAKMRLPMSLLNSHWSRYLWAIGGLYTRR